MTVSEPAHPERPSRPGGAMLLTDRFQACPGVVVVTVRGELDLSTEPAFQAALASAAAEVAAGVLVCDLSSVVFLSCGALSILVQARADLRARAAVLRVVAQRSIVSRMITLSGLAEAFDLHHDLAEACQPLR